MGNEKKLTATTGTSSTTTRITQNPYKEVAEFRNGMFHFSFQSSLEWMEKQGKILFGNHFHIFRQDYPVIYKLLIYAIGDRENTQKQGIDPDKGIILIGPVGVGKTCLMKLTSYFCPPEKQYLVKPARELSFELEQEGYKVITRYSKGAFRIGSNGPVPVVYCFDDLGVEQPLKYFGNDCQIMAEILLSRYELFVSKGMLTHVTTNFSASELEARYGNRVRSRLREMCNLVAFDKDSKDKRS